MGWMLSLFLLVAACDASDPPSDAVVLADEEDNSGRAFLDAGRRTGRDAEGALDGMQRPADGGGSTRDGAADRQTAEHESDADARTRVIALLHESNRGARLTCPCQAQQGAFESEQACIAAIGYTESVIKCVGDAITKLDRPALGPQLACEAKRMKQRNDCLQEAACVEDAVNECYASQLECPPPDARVLTKVLSDCPGAIVLGR